MPLLVVDGGGSSARALAVDERGQILAAARGDGASASPAAGSGSSLTEALATLLGRLSRDPEAACGAAPQAAAGVPAEVTSLLARGPLHVVAGLAGTGRPAGAARAEAALWAATERAGLAVARVRVTTDVRLALSAVAPHAPGPASVVLAGTGSIALAVDSHGSTARAGGLGRYLSDEGGGFWIGARALAEAARHADGRAPDSAALAEAVLRRAGLADLDSLVEAAPALWASAARVAALAPVVLELAAGGDGAARRIVDDAGRALADLALAAREQLGLPDAAPLGLGGSLLLGANADAGWTRRGARGRRSEAGGAGPEPGSPLAAAVRAHLPAAVAGSARPLAVPPAVGEACAWLHRYGEGEAGEAVARLLGQAERWTDVLR